MNALLLLIAMAHGSPLKPPTAEGVPTYAPARSFAPLVEAVAPAVVAIEVESIDPTSVGTTGRRHGEGSGFLISEDGLVLTNNHVVTGITGLEVRLHDGSTAKASILGTDADMDVALLRLEGAGPFPYVDLGNSKNLRVGDWVLAVGNPLGLGTTVTAGIVSAKGRVLNTDKFYRSDDYIQTDAAINQGNSGGPLFDLDGGVVGMNTAIIAGANTIGFAISADLLREVVPDLQEHGRVVRGFLGVNARRLSTREREASGLKQGAVIHKVFKGTPAARSGLRTGDVVLELSGSPITDGADLMASVGNRRPGDVVELRVHRVDGERNIQLELTEKPDAESPPLGLHLTSLTSRIAQSAGVAKGVVVDRVQFGSPAADFILHGDVLVRIDGREIATPDAALSLLRKKRSKAIKFELVRGSDAKVVVVPAR